MKKLFLFLSLLILALPVFCQPEIPDPTGIVQWVGALQIYLGSIYGVYLSAPFWVAILLGVMNLTEASKWFKYLFTGIVSLVLLLLAYFLDFGFLHGSAWWWILPNLVGVMVMNIFGYALIKAALDKLADKFNPWK